jgi:ribosome-associated toxin RatA of RatAB toxin-antitoxin module
LKYCTFRYSPEQLFDVVAAVDLYHGFVPWCQRSEILKHYPDGSFDAELEIGFKFLVESYISHVELNRPKSLKVTDFLSVFVVVVKIVFALFFQWKIYIV